MQPRQSIGLAAIVTLAIGFATLTRPAIASNFEQKIASNFEQKEVDTSRFVLAAFPYGNGLHQLLILEQLSDARLCWREYGDNTVQIEPLLLNFDFTGICSRSTDSNGYSIRLAGEDLSWRYRLQVVQQGNDLVLIGKPNVDANAPELLIARTSGSAPRFAKLVLQPGWRLTKRAYQGKVLGHVYLTNDRSLADLAAPDAAPESSPSAPSAPASPMPLEPASPPTDSPNHSQKNPSSPALATGSTALREYVFTPAAAPTPEPSPTQEPSSTPSSFHQPNSPKTPTPAPPPEPSLTPAVAVTPEPAPTPAPSETSTPSPQPASPKKPALISAIAAPAPAESSTVPSEPLREYTFTPAPAPAAPEATTARSANQDSAEAPAAEPITDAERTPNRRLFAILPVPGKRLPPLGNAGRRRWLPPSPSSAGSNFTNTPTYAFFPIYRVIVPASNPSLQDKVRSLVPNALRTRWKGRTVMQAGLFEDRASAEAIRLLLNDHNLKARIVPVR